MLTNRCPCTTFIITAISSSKKTFAYCFFFSFQFSPLSRTRTCGDAVENESTIKWPIMTVCCALQQAVRMLALRVGFASAACVAIRSR